jgi:putative phosphoribosyl transferase
MTRTVSVAGAGATLAGDLTIPPGATSIVLFAHGSGSSRLSPRNRRVAARLHAGGFATLLFALLTPEEEALDEATGHLRFDVELLAKRLVGATDWLGSQPETRELRVGYFGASTGAAAAVIAAALRPQVAHAVVSRGGRPDLAGAYLGRLRAPILLIVGGEDTPVIALNRAALAQIQAEPRELVIVPGAGHLFEEPGTLEQVAELAAGWFARYLGTATPLRAR